ncbi:MAG: late control protein [Sphingomonas bacterium]|nr:contractile injection system protein, VgrG/Pvc8 family [Sphingomonas bacterium]MDB5690797.1 late control protein [Sphingomonas bacterium]
MTFVANIPNWRVTLDGLDLTDRLRPRLVSLTLSEKRGDEADQLDIVIDDHDGTMALPRAGATLHVHLGWKQGSAVTPGLIDKGSFVVDEIEHSGPPDIITIRARSADFTGAIRTRRDKSWHDTTIGTIVAEVAARHQLTARCAPALAGIVVPSAAQSRESDLAWLRRIGREHDAVATIKRGSLIFAAIGAGVTPTGKPLPSVTIRRRDGDRHSFRIEKREETTGVTASWHDRKGAKKQTVTVGGADAPKRLGRVYATEAAARTAASAEKARAARQPRKLSFDLALGRPDIYPEQRVKAEGFKAEIDAIAWLVAQVTHSLGDRGLVTSVQLETVG